MTYILNNVLCKIKRVWNKSNATYLARIKQTIFLFSHFFSSYFSFLYIVCRHLVAKNHLFLRRKSFWLFEPVLIIIFLIFCCLLLVLILIIFKRFLSVLVDESYSIIRQFCAVSEKTVNEKSFFVCIVRSGCWVYCFLCCFCYIAYDDIVMALYHSFFELKRRDRKCRENWKVNCVYGVRAPGSRVYMLHTLMQTN